MTGNLNMGGKSITNATFVGDGSGLTNITVTLPNHWTDNVIWVATNGTPAVPSTVDSPYDTIQGGYNVAAAKYLNKPSTVLVAAGVYTNMLVINAGSVHVQGLARPEIWNQVMVVASSAPFLGGKQRFQGIVVKGPTQVTQEGGGIKFHNSRFEAPVNVDGSNVEFQDCQINPNEEAQFSLRIGAPSVLATNIGVLMTLTTLHILVVKLCFLILGMTDKCW